MNLAIMIIGGRIFSSFWYLVRRPFWGSRRLFTIVWLALPVFVICFLPACSQQEDDNEDQVLMRVGDRVITVFDFNRALEITKAAYPPDNKQQPEDLKKAKLRLLNQMTIEMILLARADELGIGITADELEKAVASIKGDYPEGEFEETLLESAVSYDTWENRLKTRLIMEKVIDHELKARAILSSEDISEFYENNYQGKEIPLGTSEASEDINETLLKQLRRKKAEDAYQNWIKELKKNYTIEIDSEQWEKIAGVRTLNANELTLDAAESNP